MPVAHVGLIAHAVLTVNAALINKIVVIVRMVIVTVSITVHVELFVNVARSLWNMELVDVINPAFVDLDVNVLKIVDAVLKTK